MTNKTIYHFALIKKMQRKSKFKSFVINKKTLIKNIAELESVLKGMKEKNRIILKTYGLLSRILKCDKDTVKSMDFVQTYNATIFALQMQRQQLCMFELKDRRQIFEG